LKKLAVKYFPISRVCFGLAEKTLVAGLQINKSVSSRLSSIKVLAIYNINYFIEKIIKNLLLLLDNLIYIYIYIFMLKEQNYGVDFFFLV